MRAPDNLALSSRNGYLTPEERNKAPYLNQVMNTIADQLTAGQTDISTLIAEAGSQLREYGFTPDNIAICDSETLQPLTSDSRNAVILMAAWLGDARLIDNQTVAL